jgi:hypothetical protein
MALPDLCAGAVHEERVLEGNFHVASAYNDTSLHFFPVGAVQSLETYLST